VVREANGNAPRVAPPVGLGSLNSGTRTTKYEPHVTPLVRLALAVTIALLALAGLIVADPFTGPRTRDNRIAEAQKSGGENARLWLANYDVMAAVERYHAEIGMIPPGLSQLRPYLSADTRAFLDQPENDATWTVVDHDNIVDSTASKTLEVAVYSRTKKVWESYVIRPATPNRNQTERPPAR
jgi:hypothetical protein